MYDNASEIYNEYLEIYFNEYKLLSDAQKKDLDNKYDPIDLFHETYDYDIWFQNEELADVIQDKKESKLSDMPLLEGVEEVKEGKLQTNY